MKLRDKWGQWQSHWKDVRKTAGFRNVLLYLVFVAIAGLFWAIMSLNESVEDNFDVNVRIYNVPDSVTFIQEPPVSIHVDVRDKGTSLMRNGWMKRPTMMLNFKEFASDGIFRFTSNDLYSSLRDLFGSNAQIATASIDSLRLEYTALPGKRVPVDVAYQVTTASGKVLAGKPYTTQKNVLVYSSSDVIDTLTRVFTERIVMRNLEDTQQVSVKLHPIPGVRIQPSEVKVVIPVEAMVSKTSQVAVKVYHVPAGEDIILFPSMVNVSYFVPLSKFSGENPHIMVTADYRDISKPGQKRLPLTVSGYPEWLQNVQLQQDSVEYTIVR